MPVAKGKSPVMAKLLNAPGARAAFDKHKGDETRLPEGGDLPPGIEGGVAELTTAVIEEIKKDGANKGKLQMRLEGTVKKPLEHNGLKVEGKRATKMISLFDVPAKGNSKARSVEDQIDSALNEMRLLGVDTRSIGMDQWEDALAALVQNGTHFSFRTWKGSPTPQFPNPRVNVVFQGKCDPGGPVDASGGVEDHTASGTDWAAIGEAADGGNDEAIAQIIDTGTALGVDTNGFGTWAEAAAAVAEAEAAGGSAEGSAEGSGDEGGAEAEAPAEEAWKPKKDDIYGYKPKGAKKETEHKVTSVDETKQLVSLVSCVDKSKSYKGIAWTDLKQA